MRKMSIVFLGVLMMMLVGCGGEKVKKVDFTELVDFVVEAPEGEEFRILQITDTQIIDAGQRRFEGRRVAGDKLTDEELYEKCFYYIEKAVEQAQPALILLTGDIVYGEFDDSGESLQKIVAYMESLGLPWAPVFGNHDNESTKGVTWQCKQFEEAEHCLFKRGDLTGNGNYTIGIEQGGKLIKVIYMLDSNGCSNAFSYSYDPTFGSYNEGEKICTAPGFGHDQLEWIDISASYMERTLGYVPSKFIAFHIPTSDFFRAAYDKGYTTVTPDDRMASRVNFVIDDPTGEDFGEKNEGGNGIDCKELWPLLKKHEFDGAFAGHNHINSFSIVNDGIRVTFGLKTGTMDYNKENLLGGTKITVAPGGESFTVEHVYVPKFGK